VDSNHLKNIDVGFERLLLDILHGVDQLEFTPERRALRRQVVDADDLAFCKTYYPKIFDLEFNALHRHIAGLKEGKYTVEGFPMSGKTAFTFITKIIKPMLTGGNGLFNVTLRTQDIAKERTFHIFRLITFNRLLMFDYEPNILQEQKGYYIINKATLVATSVETGLRNFVDDDFKRFKVSVADDLYNRVSVRSEKDNENVAEFVTGELYRQMEPDGLSVWLGNGIKEDCPIRRVSNLFPDQNFIFPIVDENGNSNWEVKYPTEKLPELQKDIPWDVWEGEWLCKPAMKGDIFQKDWLHTININLLKIIASLSACDPSHGKSPAACNKGLITGGVTSKHEVIVQDIYLRTESYETMFDYVAALRQRISNWKVLLFENDFEQWNFADAYYKDWMKTRKSTLPIMTFYSKDNATEYRGADKESRILNLVHPHQTGMILYSDLLTGTSDWVKFQSQYLAFGKAKEKQDGLDALATLYIMIFRYIETGNFKATKSKRYQKPGWFAKFREGR
jgi:hypothetical protein